MVKDRCEKYKGNNTLGFGKNYVYKHCKRCPKNKTWKINKYNTPGFKPAIFTIGNSCHDTEKLNAEIDKRNKKKEKVSKNCVYFKNQWKYGKLNGYPCKGSKGEKEFRKYLDDKVNEMVAEKKNPGKIYHPKHRIFDKSDSELNKFFDQRIKDYKNNRKRLFKEMDDFYKSQSKKGGRTKKISKRTRRRSRRK